MANIPHPRSCELSSQDLLLAAVLEERLYDAELLLETSRGTSEAEERATATYSKSECKQETTHSEGEREIQTEGDGRG
eukprot:947836-Alexandrium_andersonii.AAC.1